MPIKCGPPPKIRPPKPPRPTGWVDHGILKARVCKDEDIFIPNKRDDAMMEENRQLLERIEELEAENLVLKDKLLQIEFGGEDQKELPQPPEMPSEPSLQYIRD